MIQLELSSQDYAALLASGEIKPGDLVFVPSKHCMTYEIGDDGNLVGLAATHSPEKVLGENVSWIVYRWVADHDSA